MSDEKKPGNLQKMKDAIKNKPKKDYFTPADLKKANQQVAAAATPAVPKKPKNNYRTAKARDVRTKAHGRLPVGAAISAEWDGEKWVGSLTIWHEVSGSGHLLKGFDHKADGLFRLMEELDVMFWEWLAKQATAEEKNRLTFAPDPPSPAPWENPSPAEGTATELH